MAIDFPNSPTVNQTFTSGSTTWVWDGTAWNLQTTTTASNDSMPVGSIMWFAVSSTPTGWLPCDGTTYTNTAYPNLVAVIGTTFGGTAGTNFKVPTISATTGAYYIRYTTAVGVTSTLSLLSAPVGSMVQWPVTSSYPTGWLRCDGSNISRTTYADLFTLIGTTYGTGDGSTTFTLPNISAAGSGSPVYIIKATSSGVIEPSTVAHAASHVRGGTDIIDGDRVQVDYTPTRYTRDSSNSNAGANTDLTAHLKGIDTSVGQGHIVCTSTTRPSTPNTGTMIYETDTGFIVVYNGTTWVQMMSPTNPPAVQLINPTTVTNGTNNSGNVTFSGISAVYIDGCFSSKFDHYRVLVDSTSCSNSGTQLYMRFRSSGSDYAGANYYYGGYYGNVNNSVSGLWSGGGQTQFHLQHLWGGRCKVSMDIYRPYTANEHVVNWQGFGDNNSWQFGNFVGGSELGGTARDGLVFWAGAGTWGGSIRIYGYRNSI